MSDYTRWYRSGTVALTNGSKAITGTDTFWLTAGLKAGDLFTVDASQFYEIDTITDNTHITLKTAYSGTTTTESTYSIIRNFNSTMSAQTAANTAELLGDFRKYVDMDMKSIHGKSAYQIACDKGYVGTESEWLASLKGDSAYTIAKNNGYSGTETEWLNSLLAAGEWEELDERTKLLKEEGSLNLVALKNTIVRGKNLGPFSSDWYSAISSKKGLWLGDYWSMTVEDSMEFNNGYNHKNQLNWQIVGFLQNRIIIMPKWGWIGYTDSPEHRGTFNSVESGTCGEPDANGNYFISHNEYPESNWYVNLMPTFIEKIEAIFGADHIVETTKLVVSARNQSTGIPSWVVGLKSKAHLPSVANLYGYQFMMANYRSSPNITWDHVYMPYHFSLYRLSPNSIPMCATSDKCGKILMYIGFDPDNPQPQFDIAYTNHTLGLIYPYFLLV